MFTDILCVILALLAWGVILGASIAASFALLVALPAWLIGIVFGMGFIKASALVLLIWFVLTVIA